MSTENALNNQDDPQPLAIAKLMLAMAWAGGKLEHDDVLKIQTYLSGALTLNDRLQQSFNLYHEYPIDPMERRRLARRYSQRFKNSREHKALILQLESLMPADGKNLNKLMAFQDIKEALVEDQINFIKKVRYKLTRTPFPAKVSHRGREVYLSEYNSNPILFRLKLRFGDRFASIGLTPNNAEKLSLEMALISLVVYADQILLPEELEGITEYLESHWKLAEEHAEVVITVALCRQATRSQIPICCQRYTEMSTYDERVDLYLLLGRLAIVDHVLTRGESQILEIVADSLDIPAGVRKSIIPDGIDIEIAG
ncbi:MAG: TerB family tellurite resistance protein [Verrucomicrobiota bacterium]